MDDIDVGVDTVTDAKLVLKSIDLVPGDWGIASRVR
jgi:hypothetical protein